MPGKQFLRFIAGTTSGFSPFSICDQWKISFDGKFQFRSCLGKIVDDSDSQKILISNEKTWNYNLLSGSKTGSGVNLIGGSLAFVEAVINADSSILD
tara:strand:- start:136 stop:426 length:291 start_codon:yes stop_codon:yes gene_type:complete